jgi:hypothetical protein
MYCVLISFFLVEGGSHYHLLKLFYDSVPFPWQRSDSEKDIIRLTPRVAAFLDESKQEMKTATMVQQITGEQEPSGAIHLATAAL